MHPLIIVLPPRWISRQHGDQPPTVFRHRGWGLLGILLVICAFTLLSEAVGTGKIDLAVAYATWGAIGILGNRRYRGLLLFGERLRPVVAGSA